MGAEAFERTLRQKLANGIDIEADLPKDKRNSFADFAEQWMEKYVIPTNRLSTQKEKRSALNAWLIPSFGELLLEEITTSRIDSAISEWRKAGLSAKRINNLLTVLHKCLSIAEDWGNLSHIPKVRWEKVVPPDPKYLTRDEFESLLAATDPGFWRTFVLFFLRTGVRFGEAIGLRWEDLDLNEDSPTVRIQRAVEHGVIGEPKTKAGKRIIPLDAETAAALRAFRHDRPFVFSRENGKFYRHDSCTRYLTRACERAGIKRTTWHPLRHSCATAHVTSGTPIVVIKDILGHEDIRVTTRYAHVDQTTMRSHIERVGSLSGTKPLFDNGVSAGRQQEKKIPEVLPD